MPNLRRSTGGRDPLRGLSGLALAVAAVLAAACSGEPNAPPTGALTIIVSGLPAGLDADVRVAGPSGYSQTVTASITLSGLAPGSYTLIASTVTGGGQVYAPAATSQTVDVPQGTGSAEVVYAAQTGTLAVTVSGLPPGVGAAVQVSGPAGYGATLGSSTSLSGLLQGVYTVAAQSVPVGGDSYDPSPTSQSASITAGSTTAITIAYASAHPAVINLRIDGLYLTQSVQTYAGAVPLVAGRDGVLRVFVTANQANAAQPAVQVRFFEAGALVADTLLPAPTSAVPLSSDEASLGASWNLRVAGSLLRPGLSVQAQVDPGEAVAESDESDNSFPQSGTPLALDVRTAPTFRVRFVPIVQSATGRRGDVSNASIPAYLSDALRMHPLAAVDADLRAPFTSTAPALTAGNDNGEWTIILNELDALRVADGNGRYYYGVVSPTYSAGVAGIGYIGGQTAIGWDLGGAGEVAAHEWGHNWGRWHAPCGGAGNPDPNYPYAGGAIGVYGLDVAADSIRTPAWSDLMGYCSHVWISDYTYRGVMSWRALQPDAALASAPTVQPCLLVWGRVVDGRPVLEPSFTVVTRPSLPARPGPYRVEGAAADGTAIFSLSFDALAVADDPRGGEQFAFAVPLAPAQSERLSTVRLSVPGRGAAVASWSGPFTAEVRARRAAPGRVALTWDASRSPMLLVRDPASGAILSFARGGRSDVATEGSELDVQPSAGPGRRAVRIAVPAR